MRAERGAALMIVAGVLAGASWMLMGQSVSARCTEAAGPADSAALKPENVFLAIAAPRAGEMVTEEIPNQTVTVVVDFSGPALVNADRAQAIDAYHLAVFVDSDASAYVGTLLPIPRCNPHIVHTASTNITLEHVMHGSHTLWVLLVGSNNVSVNPPVATSITFVVD
jgi:hypothetical protein